jgi:hypothetical protein
MHLRVLNILGAIVLILFIFLSVGCEKDSITQGRNAYMAYFNSTLKDPTSLKIYSEKIIPYDPNNSEIPDPTCGSCINFKVDYGAKNGFGAYVRDEKVFVTMSGVVLSVDGIFQGKTE